MLKYVPGRRCEGKEALKSKGSYLREERVNMKPSSFDKLEDFLKERRRHLTTYIRETREVEVGGQEEVDVGGQEEVVAEDELGDDEDLEMGRAEQLAHSEDEEIFSDGLEDDEDSD